MEIQKALTGEKIEDWTFASADTHYMSHGLHQYPARMIPQIARRLINKYASFGDLVLDPFCGSGGVLVESRLHGMNSVGIDINPLACLLARVKSTPLNPNTLYDCWIGLRAKMKEDLALGKWNKVEDLLKKANDTENGKESISLIKEVILKFRELEVDVPDFSSINIFYWFKPSTIKDLAIIKKHLYDDVSDEKSRRFFHACFSSTVRQVSGTRKGEFKLYRIPRNKWEKYNPDVLRIFARNVANAITKMGEFYDFCKKNHRMEPYSEVFESDTRKVFSKEFPEKAKKLLFDREGNKTYGKVKLIVTSPPYGDSHTTVAYGQFSRYSLLWLGYDKKKIYQIDKESLGGRRKQENPPSETFNEIFNKIATMDGKRAEEVKSFFVDLNECLVNLYYLLKDGGHACFVLGNRTVKGFKIPTDQIIVEFGENIGFIPPKRVIHRRIPTKRIPWKSSPTNIPGQKVETISEENIIILER